MSLIALADFGSTYTKLSLVEREEGHLLARAQAPTTTGTDLMHGYATALEAATSRLPRPAVVEDRLAASSAGGGLRVAAVGLVADLTAAAAGQAALNAGARVGTVLAGGIGDAELDQLDAARPEIILFAGGTDGGQEELVLENARNLARRGSDAYVVVACNAAIAERVAEVLDASGITAQVAGNVMPRLGSLAIDSAREAILRLFLDHVIGGKGLSASPEFARMVKMPTPEAVLEATALLSRGTASRRGWGDIVVIDVGGATTDVHSARVAERASPGIEDPLLPAPLVRRTVEGDLGLRAGAPGVAAADGNWLGAQLGPGAGEALTAAAELRAGHPELVPANPAESRLDGLLAVGCATHALDRHCGTMLLTRSQKGPPTLVREGPDLREVRRMIGTGGVFSHRDDGTEILRQALARRAPRSLAPRQPALGVDASHTFAAAGLLASIDADGALRLLESQLGSGQDD